MTQQIINIGTADNDGTGDTFRASFNKTNQNFTELYGRGSGAPVGAEYITSTTDATLTAERVLTDTATVTWDRTTAGQIKANATGSGSGAGGPPQGRLTLQSLTPVMTTTQAAKTTIYYTPYVGNQVPIYDGTNMVMTTFAELSVATSDTTKSPAAIGASKVNDWFVWNDAGTIRIGHGPDWTSDTARSAGTALVMVGGVLLNNVAITNGPAASRGTYVGTTRSNASSQLDWIYGGIGVGGVAGVFGVWNTYNRRPVISFSGDSTDSWTYASNVWRAANNSATIRTSFVIGLVEDVIFAQHNAGGFGDGSTALAFVGVGLNSTTSFSGSTSFNAASATFPLVATSVANPVLGYNFVSAIEYAFNGTIGFTGDNGRSAQQQSGLNFMGWM